MRQFSIALIVLVLAGCAFANAGKTERLQIGMTRQEVVAAIGRPASVGADKEGESLYYRLAETRSDARNGITTTFVVRLIGGRVESFERIHDSKTAAACERCARRNNDPAPMVIPPPVIVPPPPPPIVITPPPPPPPSH